MQHQPAFNNVDNVMYVTTEREQTTVNEMVNVKSNVGTHRTCKRRNEAMNVETNVTNVNNEITERET